MPYLVKIRVKEYVYKFITDLGKTFTAGSGPKDDIFIDSLCPKQIKLCFKGDKLTFSVKNFSDVSVSELPAGKSRIISESKDISIFWDNYCGKSDLEFKVPFTGVLTVGRKHDCNIVLNNSRVSGYHCTIKCEDGNVRLEDGYKGKASSNGTYVNGKRMSVALLQSGDVVDIEEFRITFKNMIFTFDNVGDSLDINHIPVAVDVSLKSVDMKYRRSARERSAMPSKAIVLDRAPAKLGKVQKRRGMFTSLVSSGAMIGASVAAGAVSPALIAARAAGMAAPLVNIGVYGNDNRKNKKEWEKKMEERRIKYGEYIEAQLAKINAIAEEQRRIITDENPSPDKWRTVVNELQPRLWERRPIDSDFLSVRLGMGYEDLCVDVKSQSEAGFQMEEDEVEKLAQEIKEQTRIVDNVPLRLDMKKFRTIGFVGERSIINNLLKNIIVSLSAAHFYEDVKIVGVFDKSEEDIWESLRWLPHIWDEEKQYRFLAFSKEEADRIDETMYEIIHQRLEAREDYNQVMPHPHYIFIFGSYDYVKKSKLLANLLSCSDKLGATTLLAYNLGEADPDIQMTYLPPECQFVVNAKNEYPCAYEFARANRKAVFTRDTDISDSVFDSFCRNMSAITLIDGAGKQELPNGISFMEGLDVSNVNDIDVWSRWNDSTRKEMLKATLGIMSNGKHLTIDIGDLNQPPITLVGGMSGSGKSEFLKTMILSLALNHSPEDLEMVIIDYKGGSMAASVEKLPHITGKITDIEGDIMRPLVSLSYEIHRRKLLFAELGIQDYKDFLKLKRKGEYNEPLPMMVIICDEFAELKQQHREFMDNLVEIARQGRSLGIRLVLATQSPAGVVSQDLVDNSRFQICLKVQNAAASKSLIERADAARLTQNGRAYVKAGSDEIFELIQSYWTGAPYFGNRHQKATVGNQVRIVSVTGERINTVIEEKTRFKSDIVELQAIINKICAVAEEHGISRRACPWKADLPTLIDITELGELGGFDGSDWRPSPMGWFRIPIGIYDIPERQEQGIQYINFDTESHYGIYGLPGTGKTTILKTIIMQLGMHYTPDDVNIFILDMGSCTMKMFEGMPHVGGVAIASEEDKLKKIADYIGNAISERKKKFAQRGVSTYRSYRDVGDVDVPSIILAVDNLLPLFEVAPEFETLIYQIGSEGASYGVYLIYTANSNNGIRYKLTANIFSGISFEMGDKALYTETVGRVEQPNALGKIKGRGYFKSTSPIIFQAAVYGKGDNEQERQKWCESLIDRMEKYWEGNSVNVIPTIPDSVSADDMKKNYTEKSVVPLGSDLSTGKAVFFDFKSSPTALILGEGRQGQSETLKAVARVLSGGDFANRIIVIDSASARLKSLEPICEKYLSSPASEELDEVIKSIISEMISRQSGESTDYENIYLMIDSIEELTDILDQNDGIYKRFNALCKNAAGLGMAIIVGGEIDKISEMHIVNAVVSGFVQNQQGVAVSGTGLKCNFMLNKNVISEIGMIKLSQQKSLLLAGGEAIPFVCMSDSNGI